MLGSSRCGPGDPPGVGLETPQVWDWRPPGFGPGDPLGVGLETPTGQTPQLPPWVWAWRPPPPARPLNFPLGCGPGDLQGMLGYHPPPLDTCKTCWDTTGNACWDIIPPSLFLIANTSCLLLDPTIECHRSRFKGSLPLVLSQVGGTAQRYTSDHEVEMSDQTPR